MASNFITAEDIEKAPVFLFDDMTPTQKQQFIANMETEGASLRSDGIVNGQQRRKSVQEGIDGTDNGNLRRQNDELEPQYRRRLSLAFPASPHLDENKTNGAHENRTGLGAVSRHKDSIQAGQERSIVDNGESQVMSFLQSMNATIHSDIDSMNTNMNTKHEELKAEIQMTNMRMELMHDDMQEMKTRIDKVEINFENKCDEMRKEASVTVTRLEGEIHEVHDTLEQTKLNIQHNTEKFNTQIEGNYKDLRKRNEKCEKDIDEVREKVTKLVDGIDNTQHTKFGSNIDFVSTRIRHNEMATNALIQSNILYNGDYTCALHPMEFLKRIEEKFRQYNINDAYKIDIVARCLIKDASQWFQQISVETYEQFRVLFVKKYWNNLHQSRFVRYIYSGKYQPQMGSMVKYTETLMHNAKYIEDVLPLSEKDLITIVMEHLPYRIKNTGRHVTTAEGIIEYLIQIDDEENIANENRAKRVARDINNHGSHNNAGFNHKHRLDTQQFQPHSNKTNTNNKPVQNKQEN